MRIWSSPLREARWFSFELSSDADIHDALDWLGGLMTQRRRVRNPDSLADL